MPIYEYHCQKCGVFEVTQRITESPLTTCPTCEGDVRRLISLTSFVLKGSGWYATDYARSNGKDESSAGGSTSKEGTAKEGTAKEGTANASGSSETSAAASSEPKTSPVESSKSSSDKSASAKSAV